MVVRVGYLIEKCRILNCLTTRLVYLGQITIPIMFMHVPFSIWRAEFGYGKFIYVLIEVGIPVAFTRAFNKCKIMRKMFGLSVFKRYILIFKNHIFINRR